MISSKSIDRESAAPHPQRRSVQIDVFHGRSRLEPAPDEKLLEGVINYTQKTFQATGEGQIAEQVEQCDLYEIDGKRMGIPTGLVPAVVKRLKESGKQTVVKDHREFGPTHNTSQQVLSEADEDDRRLLQAVEQHPLGQIEVRGTSKMIEIMHLIRQFFPEANILIPVSTRKFAWYLWRELRGFAGSGVRLNRGSWPTKPPPCMVTTYMPLETCIPEHWDIILLPDAAHATHKLSSWAMGVFVGSPCRCYSFVRPGQQMGWRSRIRLEAMSGQVIFDIEPGKPAVEVLWVQPPQQGTSGCERRTLEWKRTAYWHNEVRNQLIAEAAQAFATKDVKKLRAYGVRFENGEPALANSEPPKVVLLVESVEHGQELLKRLDGWALLDSAAVRRNYPDSDAKGEIITATRAAACGLDADVVIQAVGGAGTGVFRNTVIERSTAADNLPTIIVDLADSGDDMAAADVRARYRTYQRLGWDQHGFPRRSSTGRRRQRGLKQKGVTR